MFVRAIVLVALVAASTSARAANPDIVRVSGDEWAARSTKILQAPRKARTPVLVLYTAEWCTACKQVRGETLRDPRVTAALQRFTVFEVDDTEAKMAELPGYPFLAFYDSHGRRLPARNHVGSIAPDRLLALLETIR
jgi:thiol:disulfide interchange protein DsbD